MIGLVFKDIQKSSNVESSDIHNEAHVNAVWNKNPFDYLNLIELPHQLNVHPHRLLNKDFAISLASEKHNEVLRILSSENPVKIYCFNAYPLVLALFV